MEEEWRDIAGYEGLYQVSNLGRVKSLERRIPNSRGFGTRIVREMIKKQSCIEGRYCSASFNNNGHHKTIVIHRIVAKTFISNPKNKPTVNHRDGNKHNNRVENLEWATYSENNRHAINDLNAKRAGPKGSRSSLSRLKENQVGEIKKLLKLGIYFDREIAWMFKVDRSCITSIKLGKTWKHVPWPSDD